MNKEEMTKEIAVEIATKYANDIWLFGEVDKECVSEVCKVLLSELDIANKKLEKIEKHCNKSIEYEEREIKMLSKQHNKFDHFRIIRNNYKVLSIIREDRKWEIN